MEAQVRPLLRLPDPEQQMTAWVMAVERAEGGQPSAPEVKQVVLEILHPEADRKTNITRPATTRSRSKTQGSDPAEEVLGAGAGAD